MFYLAARLKLSHKHSSIFVVRRLYYQLPHSAIEGNNFSFSSHNIPPPTWLLFSSMITFYWPASWQRYGDVTTLTRQVFKFSSTQLSKPLKWKSTLLNSVNHKIAVQCNGLKHENIGIMFILKSFLPQPICENKWSEPCKAVHCHTTTHTFTLSVVNIQLTIVQ